MAAYLTCVSTTPMMLSRDRDSVLQLHARTRGEEGKGKGSEGKGKSWLMRFAVAPARFSTSSYFSSSFLEIYYRD